MRVERTILGTVYKEAVLASLGERGSRVWEDAECRVGSAGIDECASIYSVCTL